MTNSTLGSRAEKVQEKRIEPVSATTKYKSDAEENIIALAKKVYPDNKAEQVRYADKIIRSLKKYIQDDKTLPQLWEYLGGENCKITALIEGILHFYASEKVGENEIGLQDFLKPVFSAETDLDTAYTEARSEIIEEHTSKLADLLTEIQKDNPNL